jgi:hypothetical protein
VKDIKRDLARKYLGRFSGEIENWLRSFETEANLLSEEGANYFG